jgi:hypothetical protein
MKPMNDTISSRTIAVVEVGVILSQKVGRTFRVLFPFIWETLISDTHLDVVRLAREEIR